MLDQPNMRGNGPPWFKVSRKRVYNFPQEIINLSFGADCRVDLRGKGSGTWKASSHSPLLRGTVQVPSLFPACFSSTETPHKDSLTVYNMNMSRGTSNQIYSRFFFHLLKQKTLAIGREKEAKQSMFFFFLWLPFIVCLPYILRFLLFLVMEWEKKFSRSDLLRFFPLPLQCRMWIACWDQLGKFPPINLLISQGPSEYLAA